jgi:MFS transporter, CP family, cyanate transporter
MLSKPPLTRYEGASRKIKRNANAAYRPAQQPAYGVGVTPPLPVARLVFLWLAGMALRITVLAVPPIIPLLHADLDLSETAIGLLSSVPSFLFALAAIAGSGFTSRFGAMSTLVAGLFLTALAGAARGASPDALALFAATIVMAGSVAVMQPALAQLVRSWFPERVGFATALYTNGLLVGETLTVGLTIPLVLPAIGGSWRWDFVVWSLPVVATGLFACLIPGTRAERTAAGASPAAAHRWWPDWSVLRSWKFGVMLGSVNSIYFATNAFLPDFLTAGGHPELISAALTAENFAQVPTSFLMLAITGRLVRRPSAYVTLGALTLVGVLVMSFMSGLWVVAGAALVGGITAMTLVLAFALPPLLSAPADVSRASAAMMTVGYGCAMATPAIGGYLWDLTGMPVAAFLPVLLWPFATMLLPLSMDFRAPPG